MAPAIFHGKESRLTERPSLALQCIGYDTVPLRGQCLAAVQAKFGSVLYAIAIDQAIVEIKQGAIITVK